MDSPTDFIEANLLLAVIADDEKSIQEILKFYQEDEFAKARLHDHALTLLRRTHKDARPESKPSIGERYG